MDGTTKDRISGGKLFRPASLSQVLDEYPDVVLIILRSSTCITRESGPDGHEYFIIRDPTRVEISHELRRQDFERCVSIAKKLGNVPLFLSEPRSETYDRIRAYLKVEFLDRRDP